jgi:hypothetical protein
VMVRSSQSDHGINKGEVKVEKTPKKLEIFIGVVACLQCKMVVQLGGV